MTAEAAESAETAEAPVSALSLYRALVGVGVACAILIVGVYELTKPVIAQNRAEALERAIFRVLPGAKSSRTFEATAEGFQPAQNAAELTPRVHAGYDAEQRLIGIAIEAAGMGYQDIIEVLYGYAPETSTVVGMVVLQSRETPGLGDKIETDPQFLENFRALDVSLAEGGKALKHGIESVKRGDKTQPYQIDAITGATISSKAIASILQSSAAHWIPRLAAAQTELAP